MADRRSSPSDDATAPSETEASEPSEPSEPSGVPEQGRAGADEEGAMDDDAAGSSDAVDSSDTDDDGDVDVDADADADDNAGSAETSDERGGDDAETDADAELAALRQAVEEKYDFEDFGPDEMAEMSYEEWEAVFDADSWITGTDLLDRVEADLGNRIAGRDVFARIERLKPDPGEGEPERLLAYSDKGYALVYPDGTVDGRGTVLRDVKPTVALCSMNEYEVDDPPEGELLPDPSAVREGSGELGNFMLQITAAIQLFAGVGLVVAWIVLGVETIFAPAIGLAFVLAGVFLFLVVANARLSDRFRAEEYRERLRAVGLESGDKPDFLPIDSAESDDDSDSAT